MNYFEPVTRYYIVNIVDSDNNNLQFNGINFSDYVRENFPILYELEKESSVLENILNNDSKTNVEEYRKCIKNYLECSNLITYAMEYLNLPIYLIARGNNYNEAVEPVADISICQVNPNLATLNKRRVSDVELENYYISDYEKKILNFFYPTEITKTRANISKEELIEKRAKIVDSKRRKYEKKLMKGGN